MKIKASSELKFIILKKLTSLESSVCGVLSVWKLCEETEDDTDGNLQK